MGAQQAKLRVAALRIGVALALGLAAAAVWVHQFAYRGWEAWSAGRLSGLLLGQHTLVSRPLTAFFLNLGTAHAFGLRVTGECTSAIVTIGVCVLTGVLAVTTRISLRRLVAASAVAVGTFFALNLVRLVGIALATRQWGLQAGYHWSHVWAGTFVTVLGGIAVCALYLVVIGVRRRKA